MKMFLTSNGINNPVLVSAFFDFLGSDPSNFDVAFIANASSIFEGDKRWLVEAMHNFSTHAQWRRFDIIDVLGLPPEILYRRLSMANIIVVWGGSEQYLAYALRQCGLADKLKTMLEDKIWVGCSAGSMVVGGDIPYRMSLQIYNEPIPEAYQNSKLLELVDVAIFPHYGSSEYPGTNDENIETHVDFLGRRAYAIDDNSALIVKGDEIQIVGSPGTCRYFADPTMNRE